MQRIILSHVNFLSCRYNVSASWHCFVHLLYLYLSQKWTDFDKTWQKDGKWRRSDSVTVSARSLQGCQRNVPKTTGIFYYLFCPETVHWFSHFRNSTLPVFTKLGRNTLIIGGDWICRTGKCRTGKWRTKVQGWNLQDWKMTDKSAGLENAGLENDGQKLQGV